jgi:outer membrane protein OmpA-like peptidoglycan-associated protein
MVKAKPKYEVPDLTLVHSLDAFDAEANITLNSERLHWKRTAQKSQAASAEAARVAMLAAAAAQAALHSLHTPYKYYRLKPIRFRSIMEVRQAKMRHITKTVSYCPFSQLQVFCGDRKLVDLEGMDTRNVERGHPVIPKVVNPYDSDDDFHDPECVVEAAWQCMKEPEHLLLEYSKPTACTGYRIRTCAAEGSQGRDPADWVFEGTNDPGPEGKDRHWHLIDAHVIEHKSEWERLREMNGSELSHEEKERRRAVHKALHESASELMGPDFKLQRHEPSRHVIDKERQEYVFVEHHAVKTVRVKFVDKPDELPHERSSWVGGRATESLVDVVVREAKEAALRASQAAHKAAEWANGTIMRRIVRAERTALAAGAAAAAARAALSAARKVMAKVKVVRDRIKVEAERIDRLTQFQRWADERIGDSCPLVKVDLVGGAIHILAPVNFIGGKAVVKEESEVVVKQVAYALQCVHSVIVEHDAAPLSYFVEGHVHPTADTLEARMKGVLVSYERSITLSEYITKGGTPAECLNVKAFGSSRPKGTADQNRRVEIKLAALKDIQPVTKMRWQKVRVAVFRKPEHDPWCKLVKEALAHHRRASQGQ